MPLNLVDYSKELQSGIENLKKLAKVSPAQRGNFNHLHFDGIESVVKKITQAAEKVAAESKVLTALSKKRKSKKFVARKAHLLNSKLKQFEMAFIDEEGLPKRPWYRRTFKFYIIYIAPNLHFRFGYRAWTSPRVWSDALPWCSRKHNARQGCFECKDGNFKVEERIGSSIACTERIAVSGAACT